MNRRSFLHHTLAAGAIVASSQPLFSDTVTTGSAGAATSSTPEVKRKSPLAGATVWDFVKAGHGNLPKVKEMLAEEPMLLNAMWDWGGGDWETALGGASHVGSREVALHLLQVGARFDAFCAAMLGESEVIASLLQVHPEIANAAGPHGFTLLYHVGYSGRVEMAETVAQHLVSTSRSRHFNQALHSAVARGHTQLVAHLLEHGVDDPNSKNFMGKTSLDVALAKNYDAIVTLLRAHGAVSSG